MKTKIIFTIEEEFEKRALLNAVKNQAIIDNIYDEIFRPVIKYSDDAKEVEVAEMLWKKCSELIGE